MRAIAEQAFAFVREYKGSHSGEHGDGIVRSEFHEPMFGSRLVRAFEEVKDRFDPDGLFNPGKIVRAPKFDDRGQLPLRRRATRAQEMTTRLDWSAYTGEGGGFQGAVEMCNNNGACRASAGGVMCPSYRVTREERDVTRGRANSLRLAITGQLGPGRLHVRRDGGDDEALRVLQGLPPRMPDRRRHGAHEDRGAGGARGEIRAVAARPAGRLSAALCALCGEAAVADEPARRAARRGEVVGGDRRVQRAAHRCRNGAPDVLPRSAAARWSASERGGRAVRRHVQPLFRAREHRRRARRARPPAATRCMLRKPADGSARPLCCGRTFLSIGQVDEARQEAERTLAALAPFVARGVPVVGLEPSCLLELPRRSPGDDQGRARAAACRARADLRGVPGARGEGRPAQSAAEENRRPRAAARPLPPEGVRRLQPGRDRCSSSSPISRSRPIESSCCGMAGSFGYDADTIDVSLAMGELSLLPAVRKARCRHDHRRRRHLLPPPDPRRRRPRRAACRARAGDESAQEPRLPRRVDAAS